MLSIQAVRGLPRLRAPNIVPCVIALSLSVAISIYYRKLGSRRRTTRRAVSVEILSAVTKHFTVQLWKQVEQYSFTNRVINR